MGDSSEDDDDYRPEGIPAFLHCRFLFRCYLCIFPKRNFDVQEDEEEDEKKAKRTSKRKLAEVNEAEAEAAREQQRKEEEEAKKKEVDALWESLNKRPQRRRSAPSINSDNLQSPVSRFPSSTRSVSLTRSQKETQGST